MFYKPGEPNGLEFDPFKAIISPRPIGWIGTLNCAGIPNLAPYSFFSAISTRPHLIGFTSEGMKHSPTNAKERGEFTFSLATRDLARAMQVSSLDHADGVNEFAQADLTARTGSVIETPFVAESPAAMECVLTSFIRLEDMHGMPTNRYMLIGQVVGVHIRDACIVDGRFSTASAEPIARCGYRDYATVDETWEL